MVATLVPGKSTRNDKRKRWIDSVKEDLHQRASGVQQAAECVTDRKSWKKFVDVRDIFRRAWPPWWNGYKFLLC